MVSTRVYPAYGRIANVWKRYHDLPSKSSDLSWVKFSGIVLASLQIDLAVAGQEKLGCGVR